MDRDVITLWPTSEDVSLLFTSYAQNFEDVILARVLRADTGFYIDAGANDPEFHSVTKHFYDRGWSGVNIEPHRGFYRRLCAARPRDVILNAGLSDREGTALFHEETSGMGISSLTDFFSSWNTGLPIEDRPVELTTLARVCERYAKGPIDFLKLDVEGVERLACEGGDWARWRPRIVLIEAPFPDTFEDWDGWFRQREYLFAHFDGINRFYVRNEDSDLIPTLAVPFSSLDRAIPYQQVRLLKQLQQELNACHGDLGPTARDIARRLQRLARRFPRATSTLKRILRRAG